jgi:hypothetical protein
VTAQALKTYSRIVEAEGWKSGTEREEGHRKSVTPVLELPTVVKNGNGGNGSNGNGRRKSVPTAGD